MSKEQNSPQHIAIILDGNRRFAKKLMLEPWKGHEYGKEKVEKIIDYAKDLGIKELTFYCLSCENIEKRPKNELNYLYKIFKEAFENMDENKIKKDKIKMRFIGNLSLLPQDLKEECEKLDKQTKENNNFIINFAIAYGGRQELINTIKNIIEEGIEPKNINEETIKNYLYMPDEPDIIIRTGGEKRTSNFLPWQSVYSEWFFLDKTWPEFEKEDLIQCIEEFKNRKRNFGA